MDPNLICVCSLILQSFHNFIYHKYANFSFFNFSGWSVEDAVEKYLKAIGMEYMAQAFIGNQINGSSLLALDEYQVIQLGCHVTSDHMLFMEHLQIIKKKYNDSIAAQWSGRTPVEGCAYHQDCCQHCCARLNGKWPRKVSSGQKDWQHVNAVKLVRIWRQIEWHQIEYATRSHKISLIAQKCICLLSRAYLLFYTS